MATVDIGVKKIDCSLKQSTARFQYTRRTFFPTGPRRTESRYSVVRVTVCPIPIEWHELVPMPSQLGLKRTVTVTGRN
jgi:hypothetical protein